MLSIGIREAWNKVFPRELWLGEQDREIVQEAKLGECGDHESNSIDIQPHY